MKLTLKEAEKLAIIYRLGTVQKLRIIPQGFMNYTHVVQTKKGKYIFRIGKKTKKLKDLLFEVRFVHHLKGLPTPHYLADDRGVYVNQFQGHNYIVYPYLEGKTPKRITAFLLKQVAEFMARLHQQSNTIKKAGNRFAWYTFSKKRADEFEKFILKKLPRYAEETRFLAKQVLVNTLSARLPAGAIHCDVKFDNLLVRNKRISGVVDFDNCQKGAFVLDLGIAALWHCTTKKGLDYKKARRFIRDYQRIRKLNKLEKQSLAKAFKFAYASHEFVDYYVYAKKIISKRHLDHGRVYFLNALKKMPSNEKLNRLLFHPS